jgi:hypothetical protein
VNRDFYSRPLCITCAYAVPKIGVAAEYFGAIASAMSASTPIAMLVESMLAAGVEHRVIVSAVETAENSLRARVSSSKQSRGTRLSDDWKPSEDDIAYAAGFRMSQILIALEAQKFKNYWIAKAGAGATKRDWSATWRNWILNVLERHHDVATRRSTPGSIPNAGRRPAGADAVLAGMGRLSRRLAENRAAAESTDQQMGADANAPRQLGFDRHAKS